MRFHKHQTDVILLLMFWKFLTNVSVTQFLCGSEADECQIRLKPSNRLMNRNFSYVHVQYSVLILSLNTIFFATN